MRNLDARRARLRLMGLRAGWVLASLGLSATMALSGCLPRSGGTPSPVSSTPFTDATAASGIDFRQVSGAKPVVDIVQTSAGGVGLLDYDGDGLLDVYLVQGKHAPGTGGGNRLYHNLGDGKFQDVTEAAGVRGHGYGLGCAVGDVNADGRPDLYVCNNGTNELFVNRGNGRFEESAAKLGVAVSGCSIGAVFADLDRDHRPELYVARYVRLDKSSKLICSVNGIAISCDPQAYPAQSGVYLRPGTGGRFWDQTLASGLVNAGRGMVPLVGDFDGDQRLDLFITNDTSGNELFSRQKSGRFKSIATLAGVAYGELGVAEANMGADLGDCNGDGRLDLAIGVMQDRSSLLFRNEGEGLFTLATREAGLAEATAPVVTWGLGWLDVDQDGDLDLFQANGHVNTLARQTDPRLSYEQPRQLFENDGQGRFKDVSAAAGPALTLPAAGRGAAFGDLDNDGDIDLVVNNLDRPPLVLINTAERLKRHWLRVRLEGRAPNTQPEGAELHLKARERTLLRHCHTAYSYASANDPRVHFGLGDLTSAGPLEIRWPDGSSQTVEVGAVDRELVVKQP